MKPVSHRRILANVTCMKLKRITRITRIIDFLLEKGL